MSFFPEDEDVPLSRADPVPPPLPPWRGEPDDVVPGVVPFDVVIGRAPDTVIILTRLRAFPVGLATELVVRWRPRSWNDGLYQALTGGPDAMGRVRWGFEFSDGSKVTNVGPYPYPDPPDPGPDGDMFAAEAALGPPPRPALTSLNGKGLPGGTSWEYWLWPLPPAGALTAVCEWPERGIELTTTDLDNAAIRAAADRSTPLWPL